MERFLLSLFINLVFIFRAHGYTTMPFLEKKRNKSPIEMTILQDDPRLGKEGSRKKVLEAIHKWQAPSCSKLRIDLVPKDIAEGPDYDIDITFSFTGASIGGGKSRGYKERCEIFTASHVL
jgi:hypothetical protein